MVKRKILSLMLLILFLWRAVPVETKAVQLPVEVGGINILKTDITGNPLEGAVFRVVRLAREEELSDRTVSKTMMKIGEENRIVVCLSFWDNRELTGERKTEVTTNQEGKAAVYGLPYGTYYLVETKSPQGYNRITSPMRITIHRYSHLLEEDQVTDDKGVVIDNTVHIINVRYSLPDTGNLATLQLAAAGTGIIFSSAALILMNRKRWK